MRDETLDRNNRNNNTKKKKKKSGEFEFCKVCRLNHDQGRGHKYFPNHAKSLSSLLSRFRNKLSDVLFFLKNPSPLRPEHASRSRFWCVFCDSEIGEFGSTFACGNAINHLAGEDHLKNIKSFMWKYGGGLEQADSFRISEADLAKWEKRCKSMKSEAASERLHMPSIGPSNDIHNELNSECINSFDKITNQFLLSSSSNGVTPLQNYTNERYQVSHRESSKLGEFGPLLRDAKSCFPACTQHDSNLRALNNSTDYMDGHHSLVCNGGKCSSNHARMYQVHQDESMVIVKSTSHVLQNLTQVCPIVQEESKGNVHSGAPPPWFDAKEKDLLNVNLKPGVGSGGVASSLNKPSKCQKLNPKRVGAAWAEKRKIEIEMEKRGEIVTNNFDANWLPNFGRVWQPGSRKESRKEFEVENKNSQKPESQPELLIKIQPYVGKRMRVDTSR